MKYFISFVLLLLSPAFGLHAQEDTPEYSGDNELKINAAYLLGGFAEITLERILSEDSGIGLTVGFALDKNIDYRFGVIPHYRLYFGKKRAAGFFAEGNAAFYSECAFCSASDFSPSTYDSSTEFGAGLGLALGGKFITKKGWTAELFLGIGRNFVNNDVLNDVYPRTGLLIGKRF
jgi:hypothetical protein